MTTPNEAKKPPSLTPPVGGKPKTTAAPKNIPEGAAGAPKAAKEAKPPKAPKEPKAVKEPKESSGAGAPRPRKHEYGIKNDALVVTVAEQAEAAKRAGVAKAYEFAKAKEDGSSVTVEEFYARGGNRHDLRVMSRRGLIKIRWVTGEEFPQAATPKAPEPPKPEDAATPPVASSESQTVTPGDVAAVPAEVTKAE